MICEKGIDVCLCPNCFKEYNMEHRLRQIEGKLIGLNSILLVMWLTGLLIYILERFAQ